MQFPSRYALLVVGPLSLWNVGCSAVTHRPIAQSRTAAGTADRLLSMAQVYEQKGQLEQAHKLYCQVLQEQPNHPVAREHATDLMAAISNVQTEKDPSIKTAVAAGEPSKSGLQVASVPPAPTDPAKLGRQNRKILSDEEVAARIPKARALAKKAPASAREMQIAAVTHRETQTGIVTPAEQIQETPTTPYGTSTVLVLEERITVIEAPEPMELPAVEPEFYTPSAVAIVDVPMELPVVISRPGALSKTPAVTILESVKPSTWVATSMVRLCPDAPSHLHGFLSNLTTADPEDRKAALEEIVSSGPDARGCLPAIRACLADVDPIVQAHAAWAIWNVTGESREAGPCLVQVLECDQESAVVFACYVLGTMGRKAESAIPTLTKLQDDDSTAIRVHASEAMLKVSDQGDVAVRVLTASLASHRAEERSLAAVALGSAVHEHRQAALSALTTALYDSDSSVRCSAALAIGGFGVEAKSAVSALEVAAATTDPATREAAATALSCIRK